MRITNAVDSLLAEVRGETHPGERPIVKLGHVVLRAIDVVGAGVEALDEVNKGADLEALNEEVTEAANLAIDLLLGDKPTRGVFAKMAVASVAPAAVKALGGLSPYVESAKTAVLPVADYIVQVGERLGEAFDNDVD